LNHRPPEDQRQLRRLIAEIGLLDVADVQLILAELTPRERAHAEALLGEFAGELEGLNSLHGSIHDSPHPINERQLAPDLQGVPGWLLQRMQPSGLATNDGHTLSPAANNLLRELVSEIYRSDIRVAPEIQRPWLRWFSRRSFESVLK